MKSNRKIWCLVLLVVLMTSALFFTSADTHSQKSQGDTRFKNRSKYAVAKYDDTEPADSKEREEKQRKDKRYDKKPFVIGRLEPTDDLVLSFDAENIPPAIPASASSLIVIGQVGAPRAFLSSNKGGVYSEYSVQIEKILKKDDKKVWQEGQTVTADRRGGIVQYANGQKVLYMNDWTDMPEIGDRYILFLSREDDGSPNYKILTGYQLKDDKVTPLDSHSRFHKYDGTRREDFIANIQAEIKTGGQ